MSKRLPKRRTQVASATNRSELVDLLSNIEERLVRLDELREDGGTQPRECLDRETCQEYAERMRLGEDAQRRPRVLDPDGQAWPALTVFFDGNDHWLADGFHRASSARESGIEMFQARIRQGSQRDAILHSLGVNATHGKRRTNADKRRAVERVLVDGEWSAFSDNKIAKLCKVSQPFVSKLRKELTERGEVKTTPERIGQDGQAHDIADMIASRRATTKQKARPASITPSANAKASSSNVVCLEASRLPRDLSDIEAADRVLLRVSQQERGELRELARLDVALGDAFMTSTWSVVVDSGELVVVWSRGSIDLPPSCGGLEELVELCKIR